MNKPKPHVSEKKKNIVKEVSGLLKKYDNIGIVNMDKLPAAQLQIMKKKLSDKAKIIMLKKRIMKIIFESLKNEKKGIELLESHMEGTMPALILTNENPFKLFKIIKKSKSPAPIKAGEIAPRDLIIPAGPTQFAPGPIISELGSMGIIAGVENGKVAVKKDSVVAKKGMPVRQGVAGLLPKFGIFPMEIGLDVVAIMEKSEILTKDILDINEEEYIENIKLCARNALILSIEQGIINKMTMEIMLSKALNEAFALAREQEIITKETIGEILAKANSQSLLIKNKTQ